MATGDRDSAGKKHPARASYPGDSCSAFKQWVSQRMTVANRGAQARTAEVLAEDRKVSAVVALTTRARTRNDVGIEHLRRTIDGIGGEVPALATTVMENGAREALEVPSVTVMPMLLEVPTFEPDGVPLSCPVVPLKVAHEG